MVALFLSWKTHDANAVLHKFLINPADYMLIHTGNVVVKEFIFWIVIPIYFQQVHIQLQLLFCNTQARVRIPFEKDAFDQLDLA